MSVRALRLCRAQRLLPGLARRSFASEANPIVPPSGESTPPPPGNSASETKVALKIVREVSKASARSRGAFRKEGENGTETAASPETGKKKSWQDFQGAPLQDSSNVYWALPNIYEVGGMIPRGSKIHQTGDGGMPLWGEWGIRLEIRTSGGPYILKIPNFWLRDNCRCTQCVNQDTMQRAFDTFSIPQDIMPNQVVTEKEGLSITWDNDSHASLYPWDWIMKHKAVPWSNAVLLDKKNAPVPVAEPEPPILWGAEIAENPPSVHYDEIMANDHGVATWTEKIRRYGFCYVDGCPIDPKKTEELLERIAFIRVTHYGGFYDFTSDLTMKDTAYTTLVLPAHTDTTYFTDPAGLQMFHLLSHTSGTGGASLLVDGFHAASVLQSKSNHSYGALVQTPIPWHASGNDGITITPSKKFPVLSYGTNEAGRKRKLQQVRWNNDDRGVVGLWEPHGFGAETWYDAARKWDEILRRKDMEYWAQLEPGRPLIFDNWRVLHGRSAFTGKRRMCGGYINRDDYVSRWRNTNFGREEALRQIL